MIQWSKNTQESNKTEFGSFFSCWIPSHRRTWYRAAERKWPLHSPHSGLHRLQFHYEYHLAYRHQLPQLQNLSFQFRTLLICLHHLYNTIQYNIIFLKKLSGRSLTRIRLHVVVTSLCVGPFTNGMVQKWVDNDVANTNSTTAKILLTYLRCWKPLNLMYLATWLQSLQWAKIVRTLWQCVVP